MANLTNEEINAMFDEVNSFVDGEISTKERLSSTDKSTNEKFAPNLQQFTNMNGCVNGNSSTRSNKQHQQGQPYPKPINQYQHSLPQPSADPSGGYPWDKDLDYQSSLASASRSNTQLTGTQSSTPQQPVQNNTNNQYIFNAQMLPVQNSFNQYANVQPQLDNHWRALATMGYTGYTGPYSASLNTSMYNNGSYSTNVSLRPPFMSYSTLNMNVMTSPNYSSPTTSYNAIHFQLPVQEKAQTNNPLSFLMYEKPKASLTDIIVQIILRHTGRRILLSEVIIFFHSKYNYL